jgi:integrase
MSKYPGIDRKVGKNGRITWQARYRDSQGRQRAKSFKKKADAEAFKKQADVDRRNGGLPDQRPDRVTFNDLAGAWVRSKQHRPTTARRRDGILNKHLLPALGHLTLNKIRHSLLQDLVNSWVTDGLAPNTIRNHAQVLAAILERAVKDDVLRKNPAKGLELPKIHRTEPRALTPDECLELIEAAGETYAPILEIFLATGCRWSELAEMNVEDFNPKDHSLQVRKSKTDAGNRTIILDASEAAVITKHLLATGRSGAADGPLFTSPQGERLIYSNFRRRVFIPALRKAGITDVTLHTLRRTHATMLIADGHNAKAVQSRMGHASVQTTLSYYAVATDKDRRATSTAMGAYLDKARQGAHCSEKVG